jgi:signal transduction histidine kinase/CheY-like chemotaxis protein
MLAIATCAPATVAAAPGRASADEAGIPFAQHFLPRDFKGHSQSMGAAVDSRGVLHLANLTAIIEYDGATWRHRETPAHVNSIYGVAIGEDDVPYFGMGGELGRLVDDGNGGRRFESLREAIPAELRDDGQAYRKVLATPRGVFFQGTDVLLCWREGRFEGWRFESPRPITVHWSGSAVFVSVVGRGLLRLGDEGEWVPECVEAPVVDGVVWSASDLPDGGLLLSTMREGFLRWRGGALESFLEAEAQAYVVNARVIESARLPDGRVAFASVRGGLLILDTATRAVQVIDADNGLRTPLVARVVPDAEGGLWCLMENGVSRLEISTPITFYDERAGLRSTSTSGLVRHDGVAYLGTLRGVSRLRPAQAIDDHARWEAIKGAEGQVFSLLDHPSGVLAGADATVVQIRGGVARRVFAAGSLVYLLQASRRDPDVVYVGTRYGLAALRWREGAWVEEGFLPEFDHAVRSLWEDPETGSLWCGSLIHGATRVEGAGRGERWWDGAVFTRHGTEEGLPEGRAFVEDDGTGAVFATADGLYRFDEYSGRFVRAVDSAARPRLDGAWEWSASASDAAGNRWGDIVPIGGGDTRFGWQPAGGDWTELSASHLEPAGDRVFLHVEENTSAKILWVGGSEGLVRWDLAASTPDAPTGPSVVLVRRVTVGDAAAWLRGGTRAGRVLELPFDPGRMRFEFAAPGYDLDARPSYSTLLEGFESGWSEWSRETAREFSFLPEGRYSFRVGARAATGEVRFAEPVAIVVAPPWYRTVWSFAGYVVSGGLVVVGFVRWRGRALRRRNEQLETIVAERTEQLRAARDEADRANRAKSSFLANMSHELRTPLNGILGYTQILLRDPGLDARNRQRLGVLEASGEHLLRLINEVLDLSKIEAGRLELHPVESDVRGIVQAVAETFRPRVDAKGLTLEVELGADVPERVLVDEQKLGQVLFNLVGNAVKFTERGGVTVRASRAAGAAMRFEVIDTGVGIPAEQQAAIFEPFRQVEGAHATAGSEGTGLGLTICARIVALMGGELEVASEPGKGSRFRFDVRLPEAASVSAPALVRADRAHPIRGYTGERRRVLVVDDVPTNREIVREMLEPLGFVVSTASDGGAALAAVERVHPDLVLMDLRMTPMSGVEAVARLRGDERWGGMKIVSFSASTIGFSREDAARMGCDDHLAKPFREEDLLALLQRHLGLEWVREAAGDIGATARIEPSADRVRELLGHARRGDATGLRRHLRRLADSEPRFEGFVAEMEALANSYRMQEIRNRLEKIVRDANGER